MANNKVVIIGAGSVGATYAYALMQGGQAREIALVDMDPERALGEVMDLQHGVAFTRPVVLKVGTYADCADADIVVVTAGAKQRAGETRLDLTKRNAGIVAGITREIMANKFNGILLMVSNPVDLLTQVAWKVSGLPRRQVIGSGTVLDSARLRSLLAKQCGVDPRNVHAYIIGEHGDSEVAAWTSASIGAVPLLDYCNQCGACASRPNYAKVLDQVKSAAYEIITRKGATFYAVGLAMVQITDAILRDEHRVLPISTVIENYQGIGGVALALPTIVGRGGAERILEIPLNEEELGALRRSAETLKEHMSQIELPGAY
ncbi:MAG TPA: L-lactate dehydrogenase [Holophaga sp.]|nr:L-lactate dehydrogenase [Holophaga sp.]